MASDDEMIVDEDVQRLADGDEVIAIANLGQVSKRVADITGEDPVTPA